MPTSPNPSESHVTWRTLLFVVVAGVILFSLLSQKSATHSPAAASAGPRQAKRGETHIADKQGSAAQGAETPHDESKDRSPAPGIEFFPEPSPEEARILAALATPIEGDVVNLPLESCLTLLVENAKLPKFNFWIDRQTLTDEGVALDGPVSLQFQGRRLELILNQLLRPVQLTFVIEREVLVITTWARAGEKLITRTYPVRDLYQGRTEVPQKSVSNISGALGAPAGGAKGGTTQGGMGMMNVMNGVVTSLFQGFGGGGSQKPKMKAPDDLLTAITMNIQPDSWEELSGPGSYMYVKETGGLVVRQTLAIHREILQLLRDLREAQCAVSKDRDSTPTVECLPRPSSEERNFLEALDRPIDVQFRDLPFEQCVKSIAEQTKRAFWLDRQTLADEGVNLHQPVTLKLKDCRCESVLHLLLSPLQLALVFENDVPVITTNTKAGETLITRTYPVQDLSEVRRVQMALATVVEPDTWEDLSGPGSMCYVKEAGSLVIRQTRAVHREILQLLRDLRAAKRTGP